MRFLLSCLSCIIVWTTYAAPQETVIYEGPKDIGNWETLELSSIKFHNLMLGDTIYVYATDITPDSKGAFQNHKWKAVSDDALNGGVITGDFELIVDTEEALDEIKTFGLKVRGYDYQLKRVVIKQGDYFVRQVIMGASAVVLLTVLGFIAVLLYKNRQQNKLIRGLYIKNMEIVANRDQERRIRERYEGQLVELRNIIDRQNEGNQQKYQHSSLDDDAKELLTSRVVNLFEETTEIYAEDFNLQKLSSLVSSNYKNVSQVVNEHFGKNFNAVLNDYRIQEACRRLSDVSQYGSYTIEAIGRGLGYGSRSTFVSQFKQITGLTPSEFLHMAKSQP